MPKTYIKKMIKIATEPKEKNLHAEAYFTAEGKTPYCKYIGVS